MMEMKDIKELIRALDQSSIAKLEVVQGDHVITLEKEAAVVVTQAAQSAAGQLAPLASLSAEEPLPPVEGVSQSVAAGQNMKSTVDVRAPLVGVFYQAASPDAAPFVQIGQFVNEGDTVCILEAMKVLNEIKATKSGTIMAIHVDNGAVVEFNQILMEIG
jgi:acetyl-CoA carboxylase biotin carboxyl carrier protein